MFSFGDLITSCTSHPDKPFLTAISWARQWWSFCLNSHPTECWLTLQHQFCTPQVLQVLFSKLCLTVFRSFYVCFTQSTFAINFVENSCDATVTSYWKLILWWLTVTGVHYIHKRIKQFAITIWQWKVLPNLFINCNDSSVQIKHDSLLPLPCSAVSYISFL